LSFFYSAIFKELKDTGVKYRNRIRSRISNLKDLKNPNLRINVLLGIITPERLAVLTAEVCFHWDLYLFAKKNSFF
jgi:transcription elongation factor S-II